MDTPILNINEWYIKYQKNPIQAKLELVLIANKEMLSIYRPCPEAHTENITFFYDKRNGKILTRVIYSFESYQVCQATKEKLNSGHKHPDIFRIDQERNLLTVYYSKL